MRTHADGRGHREPASPLKFEGARLPREPVPRSLSDLLFGRRGPSEPGDPLILGTSGSAPVVLRRARLRRVVRSLIDELAGSGLAPGDTVCLLRLPRTGETGLAVLYAALTCAGYRVFLPMFPEADAFRAWLSATGSRAVIWAESELSEEGTSADRARQRDLAAIAGDLGIRCLCQRRDLRLDALLLGAGVPGIDEGTSREDVGPGPRGDEASLILTTAGSSGESKLVVYSERSFLLSCLAWHAAGLYDPALLGGRGLCLLFAHSMGIRAFWNAVWTGRPVCLVPPEWVLEHPERALGMLRHMRPEHVTGGPAVYSLLLELSRAYPDARDTAFGSLTCLVSSGASFDPSLSRRVEAAFGIPLRNAFGTTETLQVLSELVPGPFRDGLGNPLPGVAIRLEPTGGNAPYRLLVRSPFGFSGYLAPDGALDAASEWYETGDLVTAGRDGLAFAGRGSDELLKDAFGVKIPLRKVAGWYGPLPGVSHLELVPLREEPGLAALLFLDRDGATDHPVRDRRTLRAIRAAIAGRHEAIVHELDDFELRHLTIDRFACVAAAPPRTAKGNVSRGAIGRRYARLLERLTSRWRSHPGFVRVDRGPLLRSEATRFTQPRVGEVLRLLELDQAFEEARGDRLVYRDGDDRREVVDFVGGFGAGLLGHRDPELLAAARACLGETGPSPLSDQGSERTAAGALARRLSRLVGGPSGRSFVVRFGSTGAETVEMALAHAWLEHQRRLRRLLRGLRRQIGAEAPRRVERRVAEWRRILGASTPVVLALRGSYHGSSPGARAVTGRASHRRPFRPLTGFETRFVSREDPADAGAAIRACELRLPTLRRVGGRIVEDEIVTSRIFAAIAEPIGGEGGVRPTSDEVLRKLAGGPFPLILDEIQTGLGRTGRYPTDGDVEAPYVLLGKALGGGVAKISALLVERSRYVPRFDELYLSTFSADALSCTIAHHVLDRIERDDIPDRVRSAGAKLRELLAPLREEFPDVILRVAGAGLLLGVELGSPADNSLPFRLLRDREKLGLLAASYLFHRHGLRLLPTLSAPDTLRIEPSAYIDEPAMSRLASGLRALARAIRDGDFEELAGHLVRDELVACGPPTPAIRAIPRFDARIEEPAPGATRVALVDHFIAPELEMAMISPGLAALPGDARRALFHLFAAMCEGRPSIAFARNLLGGRIWWASIVIPLDSATLEELHRRGTTRDVERRIQEALRLAADLECRVAGLGAYTSVVSGSGLRLHPPGGLRVTTGNTLTAAIGLRRVLRACAGSGIDPADPGNRLAVVGASGNIGSAIAAAAATRGGFRTLLLVGRNRDRLERLRLRLLASPGGGAARTDVEVSTSLADLRDANVIVSATNTTEPFLHPRHFARDRRVLVADLSVPSVLSPEARRVPNVHTIRLAGTVTVPGTPDFVMAATIRPGTAFSCAAETMVVAAHEDETRGLPLTGPIDPAAMERLERLAEQEGMLDPAEPGRAVRDEAS